MKNNETVEALEKRLKHLLQSNFIASFDEVDIKTKEYKRDINEADLIGLRAVGYECDREKCLDCKADCKYTLDIDHAKNFTKTAPNIYAEKIKPVATIKTADDLRPCIVDEKNALFHRWENFQTVVEASPLVGGHLAGQISYTLGIVELEDGRILKVMPKKIRFCPGIHREYCFLMEGDNENNML